MNNVTFIEEMQKTYESLKYFSIKDNSLSLNTDKTYTIPFTNVTLANLNPNLFLLDANEIFHILYMLELLPKKDLTENEINFITNYVNEYLVLNDKAIENSDIDQNKVWCRSIPIYTSYSEEYSNSNVSNIIQNIINNHTSEIENSKGNHPRLVLTNPQFQTISDENNLVEFGKAGFTTLLLIIGAVFTTVLYIINFIITS